jgi:malate dehydrogenase
MAVRSDGSYGIPEDLIYGFPCRCSGGKFEIVTGLEIDDFSRAKMDATAAELAEEAEAVKDLV